jgi:hypothetical protein
MKPMLVLATDASNITTIAWEPIAAPSGAQPNLDERRRDDNYPRKNWGKPHESLERDHSRNLPRSTKPATRKLTPGD